MYTLGDLPRNGAARFADRTAIVFGDNRYTYDEFNRRVNRCAQALVTLGIPSRGRIAILADNCAKYLEIYFAAAKLGASVTPINVRLGDGEVDFVVSDSEAVVFVVGEGYESRARGLRGRVGTVQHWISLDTAVGGFHDYEALLAGAAESEPDPDRYPVAEDDLAVLMYTGGTTGRPKGVMLSHRNMMTAAIAAAIEFGATKDDATCFALPIFHVSWWPIPMMLLVGGKVCMSRRPDLDGILRLIQDEKCTHINLVPTIYSWLVDHPDAAAYDLSSLRIASYAGSPFPVEILKACITRFGNIFAQGYGATETAGAPITVLGVDDHHLDGPGVRYLASAGRPGVCSTVKVVDESDRTLEPGEIGEVWVRGSHVMLGYWKNPELTARALHGGWYHTADLGYLDEQGILFLTDRKSDMIITGGENVYPKEVEDVLYTHPAVRECSVVATPSRSWGEIVHAAVVLAPDSTVTADDLIAHCKSTLAGYKCPRAVTFLEFLPKTAVGKISKKDIKELIA
jgi:acyl-CoA synthetase (AMP-forming)/AMP-acid ligase II